LSSSNGSDELLGGGERQVGLLREVLAQQPVGVLVAAALPPAVRVADEHWHAGSALNSAWRVIAMPRSATRASTAADRRMLCQRRNDGGALRVGEREHEQLCGPGTLLTVVMRRVG